MFVVAVACFMATAATAEGSEETVPDSVAVDQPPAFGVQVDEEVIVEGIVPGDQDVEIDAHRQVEAAAGYRFVGIGDRGDRAAEYDYLHSSFAGNARIVHLGKDLKFDVDSAFLNREDYVASLMFDYAGYYRLTARTESLYHNLDHETSELNIIDDLDPLGRYGIATRQDSVQLRYKLRDYPIHLNLSHWLIDRDGTRQLRFSDYTFDPAVPIVNRNLVFQSRRIHRLSHEATAGFDAHLGPVNVVYSFLFRRLDDREGTPAYAFDSLAGPPQHNEDPESRYYSHTVKLYTSPAGGVTGAASYSHGRRDNRSSLTTVRGADKARDILHNAAGDFTYSPCAWFTAALKYRHLEIDRDTPSVLFVSSTAITPRPAIDSRRDIILASFTIRPNTILSVNGEYRGTFQHRDNTGTDPDTMWNLPANSETHKGNLTVLLRPFKGLRLRGLYEYTTTDNPLYDSDPELKHEGRLLATYTNSSRWGLSANYRVAREWNEHISRVTHPLTGSPESPETYILPRKRHFVHGALGFWVSPLERLTVSGNLGFLRTRSDQAVLFAGVFNGKDAASEYISHGVIYSANATYRAAENLDLSLAYQQVRSRSVFRPDNSTSDGTSTDGISGLSRIKTLEHSLSARADYQVTKHFGCSLDYSYRAYDNRLSSDGEGTVHAVTALVKTTW